MKKALLVILSLFSSLVFSAPEIKGSPQDLRGFLYPNDKIVTISGDAEERAYTDTAIVSLVITTEKKLLSEAIASNGSLRKKITNALTTAGISQQSINSSKFSSSPQFGWFGKKPTSYEVVNRMAISINSETQLEQVAKITDQAPEVEISNTSFEHSKKEEFNERVKVKALEKVLKQKQFYEQSLGVQLVPVGIRDSNIQQRATRGAAALEELVVTSAKLGDGNYSSESKFRSQFTESSFDEVEYEARISVDFKIEE